MASLNRWIEAFRLRTLFGGVECHPGQRVAWFKGLSRPHLHPRLPAGGGAADPGQPGPTTLVITSRVPTPPDGVRDL